MVLTVSRWFVLGFVVETIRMSDGCLLFVFFSAGKPCMNFKFIYVCVCVCVGEIYNLLYNRLFTTHPVSVAWT